MRVLALQSGSNGNAIFVQAGETQLLFDAGISAKAIRTRMAEFGYAASDLDALFVSHRHSDHAKAVGVVQRAFSPHIFLTRETLNYVTNRDPKIETNGVHLFVEGETVEVGDVAVHTIPTPHDTAGSAAFVVEYRNRRLGILTDLGHLFQAMGPLISSLDAVFLESNYDEHLLRTGPYPQHLKSRIRGSGGHISNVESAKLLAQFATHRLQWACLAHLSEENNCPNLALETHHRVNPSSLPVLVADRYGPTGVLEVRADRARLGTVAPR